MVNVIIANTKGDGEKSSEDFWFRAERLLYCAQIGYIWYEAEPEERNFLTLLELINASEAREDDEEFQSTVELLFAKLERKERTHRLCTRAAMLESYLPHPEAVTDEQVSLFLKPLFHQDSTGLKQS